MNRIPEHTVVETIKYIYEGTTIMPLHSIGTIVHIHPSGYEVEFLLRKKEFEAECGIPCKSSVVVYCPEGSVKPKED